MMYLKLNVSIVRVCILYRHSYVGEYLSHLIVVATKERTPTMSLHHINEARPSSKWALDFVGMINLPTSVQHRYILIATNYCMRWSKAQDLKEWIVYAFNKFLEENIITRFGCPHALVYDNSPTFTSLKFSHWIFKYRITLNFSFIYHPQGNSFG